MFIFVIFFTAYMGSLINLLCARFARTTCFARLTAISFIITSWYNPYIQQTMSHHRRWGDISRSTCYIFTNYILIKTICTKKSFNIPSHVLVHTFFVNISFRIKTWEKSPIGVVFFPPPLSFLPPLFPKVLKHTLSFLGIIMILLVESIRTIRGRTFIRTHRTVVRWRG
jgi:hypothetical protein